MNELENAVDMMTDSADDAQEGSEIGLDDLMKNLTAAEDAETEGTVENEGDDGRETETNEEKPEGEKDKFGRRIASALANQKRGFQKELDFSAKVRGAAGDMTEDEIAEALRSYQASKIAESDTEISPKAARKIVEEREKANANRQDTSRNDEITSALESLIDDGWTKDELKAFSLDEQVREAVNNGMGIRKAAKAYLQRQSAATTTKRRSVPTAKTAGSGSVPEENAIADMSDEEFEKFQKRVERAAMQGKRVRL